MQQDGILKAVRERLPLDEAASYLGLEPTRAGMCLCPFHSEKTPSMKLYPTHFHCFGCGAHGDVIDLWAKVEGVRPFEAAARANAVFCLGVDMSLSRRNAEEARTAQRERARRYRAAKARREKISALSDAIAGARRRINTAPDEAYLSFEPWLTYGVQWQAYLEEADSKLASDGYEADEILKEREIYYNICRKISE